MDILAFYAMAAGIIGGVLLGYLGGKAVTVRLGGGRFLFATAAVGGAAVLLPTFFFSFVVGGTLGGGYGEALLGSIGVPFGLALGIAVVLAVGIIGGASFGALFGNLIKHARAPR